jgi:hypothetical protein
MVVCRIVFPHRGQGSFVYKVIDMLSAFRLGELRTLKRVQSRCVRFLGAFRQRLNRRK